MDSKVSKNIGYIQMQVKVECPDKEAFPWYMAQVLADKYIHPYEAVQRAIEVCHLTGTDISYFEDRYLKGDKTIPVNETYTLAYMEILLQEREKSWIVK